MIQQGSTLISEKLAPNRCNGTFSRKVGAADVMGLALSIAAPLNAFPVKWSALHSFVAGPAAS